MTGLPLRARASKSNESKKSIATSLGGFALDTIHQMDAFAGLEQLPDESVDLVVTDPPYNIASKQKLTVLGGKLMTTADAWGAWDTFHSFDYDLFVGRVISQCYRVLKPGGSFYMFSAREDNGFFIRRAVERGFTYRNQLAMIRKCALPSFGKKNWRSGFELCLYMTKGKATTFNFLSQAECRNVHAYASNFKKTKHPTEKPLEFIRRLVLVSSNPGEIVLDPFMGGGTTAAAAKETSRRFIGFEKESEYIRMAEERLAAIPEKNFRSDSSREAA